MELRPLRYFVAVAELLHFGRAAERLGIRQPSLSQQIRRLEKQLGLELFERTGRGVRLTAAGRAFVEEARDLLAHADRAAVVARRASRGEVGRVRIGMAAWTDPGLVARALERFSALHDGWRIELVTAPALAQVAALRDGNLDVGFARIAVEVPGIAHQTLVSEPILVALPEAHRLAAAAVALADLCDEPLLLYPRSSAPELHDLALGLCRDAGFVPLVRHELDRPPVLLALVAAGAGLALVPAWAGQRPWPGVVFRELRPPSDRLKTVLVWRAGESAPAVGDLLEHARGAAAD